MLYWLTALSDGGDFFNLFRYITFRAGGAFMTALVFGFLFGRPLINVLRKRQGKGQPIRDDGPESHFAKAGTPTMGGLLIVGALATSTLLWARLDNQFVWLVLFVTLSFGLIGFLDDYAKVSKGNHKGVPGRVRLLAGFAIAGIATYWAMSAHAVSDVDLLARVEDYDALSGRLALPVFKDVLINLGWFFIPFGMVVIVGSANAVNLTDGLDGLAIMPVMIAAGTLGIIAYAVGRGRLYRIPGCALRPRHGRNPDLHRRPVRRWLGLFVVQCAACCSLHGRYRIPGVRWRFGRDCRSDQARAGVGRGRRAFCG